MRTGHLAVVTGAFSAIALSVVATPAAAGCCDISVQRFEYFLQGGKVVVAVRLADKDNAAWRCIGDPLGPKRAHLVLTGTTAEGKKKRMAKKRLAKASPVQFSWSLARLCKKFVAIRATLDYKLDCMASWEWQEADAWELPCQRKD